MSRRVTGKPQTRDQLLAIFVAALAGRVVWERAEDAATVAGAWFSRAGGGTGAATAAGAGARLATGGGTMSGSAVGFEAFADVAEEDGICRTFPTRAAARLALEPAPLWTPIVRKLQRKRLHKCAVPSLFQGIAKNVRKTCVSISMTLRVEQGIACV